MAPVCERVTEPPLVVLANCATAVVSEVDPLPELTVKMPEDVIRPEPVMVPLPAVPKVTPPSAVIAPLTEILFPLFVVTDSDPAPSLLAFNWMPPVCESVIDPPPVVLVSCPAAVVKVVAPLPVLSVRIPLVVNVPVLFIV